MVVPCPHFPRHPTVFHGSILVHFHLPRASPEQVFNATDVARRYAFRVLSKCVLNEQQEFWTGRFGFCSNHAQGTGVCQGVVYCETRGKGSHTVCTALEHPSVDLTFETPCQFVEHWNCRSRVQTFLFTVCETRRDGQPILPSARSAGDQC